MAQQGEPCACGAPRANGAKCKECYKTYMRDYMRKRRDNNPEQYKGYLLRTVYNITMDQYKAMLIEQNGQCGICGTTEPGQGDWF